MTVSQRAPKRSHPRQRLILATPHLLCRHAATCAGTLLLCDGTCMRAFHGGFAENDDGALEDHPCNPMGCSRELFSHIQASNEPFECPNCLARVHQCFVCKKEGASDSSGGAQEVFR